MLNLIKISLKVFNNSGSTLTVKICVEVFVRCERIFDGIDFSSDHNHIHFVLNESRANNMKSSLSLSKN